MWNFLWSAIKQADLFISHPVSNFVPDNVPLDNVVMMPATTDPFDGLNKELSEWDTHFYRLVRRKSSGDCCVLPETDMGGSRVCVSVRHGDHQVFNRVCYDQGTRPVDWSRPYVTQVSRETRG